MITRFAPINFGSKNLIALILAAGRGRRLIPYTKDLPKCLVAVGGQPILFYQLSALEVLGIKKLVIVTGYEGEKIKEYIGKIVPYFSTRYVVNERYADTNDIYSFVRAEEFCTGDILQIDSDVLFSPELLFKLFAASKENSASATCIKESPCGEEEMKVCVDEKGYVTRLGKDIHPKDTIGEFMSISLFTSDFMKALFPAMKEMVQVAGPQMYSGDAMNAILSQVPLLGVDITPYHAIEIDFPEDLLRAEKYILPKILSSAMIDMSRLI